MRGVDPADLWEAREVAVKGAHRRAVLDGKGRDVGVGDEVPGRARVQEQAAEDVAVPRAGLGDPGLVGAQKRLRRTPCLFDSEWIVRDPPVRGHSLERQQRNPRKSHPFLTVESVTQPSARRFLMRARRAERIDQNVCVNDHIFRAIPLLLRSRALHRRW